jgi:omega-hydroxy-beta-dihydromenaquinone-9 sulfotransferase
MGNNHDNIKPIQTSGSKYWFWIPRFWSGITTSGWFSLLARNHFAVHPARWPMAIILSGLSLINSVLKRIQFVIFGRKIQETKIEHDPIFVIGHWRSGTTLLHELLSLDERHAYPDTFSSYCPNHFLVSAWLLRPMLRFLLPARRPMDNMKAGWDRPQEDEFALCNMGIRSPYLTTAFPNRPPQDQEYLDLKGLPREAVEHWKAALLWFLKCLTFRDPKRIVLKSPAHTCRIRVLLEMFPNARFVHIVRDPYVIFPSTINLWKHLDRDQGLQLPRFEGLEEQVYHTFQRMYEVFQADRRLLGPGQFCEVRYEDLVENPVAQMRKIYDELKLGEFDKVQPALDDYFSRQAGYKTNRFQISAETRAEIGRRWGFFIEQYGYAPMEKARGTEEAALKSEAEMIKRE